MESPGVGGGSEPRAETCGGQACYRQAHALAQSQGARGGCLSEVVARRPTQYGNETDSRWFTLRMSVLGPFPAECSRAHTKPKGQRVGETVPGRTVLELATYLWRAGLAASPQRPCLQLQTPPAAGTSSASAPGCFKGDAESKGRCCVASLPVPGRRRGPTHHTLCLSEPRLWSLRRARRMGSKPS